MADLLATNEGGSDFNFEPIPADTYLARLFKICDLGTFTPEKGKFIKHQRKIRLVWELPTFTFKEPDQDGNVRYGMISKEYLLSLGEKATLHKDLVAWRGKSFTADELKGFNLEKLLGGTCMINIKHDQDKNDPSKVWARMSAIMKVPTGTVVPAQINATVFFNQNDENDKEIVSIFEKLTDYEKKIIQTSDEWEKRLPRIAGMISGTNQQNNQQAAAPAPAAETDDAPF